MLFERLLFSPIAASSFSGVFESLTEWIIGYVLPFLDMLTSGFIYACSPQLNTFLTAFPIMGDALAVVVKITIPIAIILTLLYMVMELVNAFNEKEFTNPVQYIIRFGVFMLLLVAAPIAINTGLSYANSVYWSVTTELGLVTKSAEVTKAQLEAAIESYESARDNASSQVKETSWWNFAQKSSNQNNAKMAVYYQATIDTLQQQIDAMGDDDTTLISTGGSYWSSLHTVLSTNIENENTVETTEAQDKAGEILEEQYENLNANFFSNPLLALGRLISGNSDVSEESQATLNMVNSTNKNVYYDLVNGSLLYNLAAFILLSLVAFKFFVVLFNVAGRYVLICLLVFMYPLFLLPVLSPKTDHVTKAYAKHLFTQLLVHTINIMFVIIFLATAATSVTSLYSTSATVTNSVTGEVMQVGNSVLWVCMMLGFLIVINDLDGLFAKLGWSVDTTRSLLGAAAVGYVAKHGMGLAKKGYEKASQVASGVEKGKNYMEQGGSLTADTSDPRHAPRTRGLSEGIGYGLGQGAGYINRLLTGKGHAKSVARKNKEANERTTMEINNQGQNGGLTGKPIGQMSLDGTDAQGKKDALKTAKDHNSTGFNGETGREYAKDVFGNGENLLPDSNAIYKGDIDADGNAQVQYSDKYGIDHNTNITKDLPDKEDGVYREGKDATGETMYASEEMNTRAVQDMIVATASNGLLAGAEADDLKGAFGAELYGDDMSTLVYNEETKAHDLYDQHGNLVAEAIQRGHEAKDGGQAITTESGEVISGLRKDDNHKHMKNKKNDNGTGMWFDREATLKNQKPTWVSVKQNADGTKETTVFTDAKEAQREEARRGQMITRYTDPKTVKNYTVTREQKCEAIDKALKDGYGYSGKSFERAFSDKFGSTLGGENYKINLDASNFNKFDRQGNATAVVQMNGNHTDTRLVTISRKPQGGSYTEIIDNAGTKYYMSSVAKGKAKENKGSEKKK